MSAEPLARWRIEFDVMATAEVAERIFEAACDDAGCLLEGGSCGPAPEEEGAS